ncbi:sulfite reductase subunit alpha [Acinetobacter haemolyticus]|uniref:sulfite reductase subunit alpha n=1 Tax=Acinetobacter haemolyticus TaxID=29430 RepID=UPI001372AF1C|nr:sulfite reductase subunit alpha [Acinetobacter haemolyticus]NAS00389.1 sulfite reductase flavoprotein subunit alpha [Acinetobacter haemolyticus]
MTQPLFWVICALFFLLLLHILVIIYLLRRQYFTRHVLSSPSVASYLVVYASQTGQAEMWAKHTAEQLQVAGKNVSLVDIQQLTKHHLQQSNTILWVVSTYGQGDAPDTAQDFVHKILVENLDLSQLSFAILALGDKRYPNFCQFGQTIEQWLLQQNAQSLFPTINVDQLNSRDLEQWLNALEQLTLTEFTRLAVKKQWIELELAYRQQINAGSCGEAIYKIQLVGDEDLNWSSGDILEIQCENNRAEIQQFIETHSQYDFSYYISKLAILNLRKQPINKNNSFAEWIDQFEVLPKREYSIASLPENGLIELVVRQQHTEVGLGVGSGWLTVGLEQGQILSAAIRVNPSFHLSKDQRPSIFIGNGTGIAGLLAHLRQREHWGFKRNWLIFGERQRQFDHLYQAEINYWQQHGYLEHVDYAFSRDQMEKVYVQDCLKTHAARLIAWVDQGAAIYVCGSLKGMASGVDQVLEELLGIEQLQQLKREQRYLRDVY